MGFFDKFGKKNKEETVSREEGPVKNQITLQAPMYTHWP